MADRDWDRERDWERGRRYRSEGPWGEDRPRDWRRREDDRGFFERAGDEVRSWFGDDEAQYRRLRDERERRWGEERRPEEADRDWARQWGYLEGRGSRDPGPSRGWGYPGGYGRGGGYQGGGYEPSGPGWTTPESSSYGRRTSPGYDYRSERYGAGWRSGVWSGPHVGRGPRGYRRSDERICEDVCERMAQDGDLDASEIEVAVVGGEVTLQGTVRDRADKRLAEDLAEQVSGVREVNNQIRIAPGPGEQQSQEGPRSRAA
jgi:hypothetical protein